MGIYWLRLPSEIVCMYMDCNLNLAKPDLAAWREDLRYNDDLLTGFIPVTDLIMQNSYMFISGSANIQLWAFYWNIGLNLLPSASVVSNLYSQLRYSTYTNVGVL